MQSTGLHKHAYVFIFLLLFYISIVLFVSLLPFSFCSLSAKSRFAKRTYLHVITSLPYIHRRASDVFSFENRPSPIQCNVPSCSWTIMFRSVPAQRIIHRAGIIYDEIKIFLASPTFICPYVDNFIGNVLLDMILHCWFITTASCKNGIIECSE